MSHLESMSTDVIALFDVDSDTVSADWLLAQIKATPGFAASVIGQYLNLWRPKVWAIEPSPATGAPEILGPGGFAIRVSPRTIEMYHTMHFSTFTGDASCREALRQACLVIANLVGSVRAIYTHELMPYDGEGLQQIESGLRARIGPPAATFEELHTADYYGPRAWYIDTFADLRSS
jgi:hypothetical protein